MVDGCKPLRKFTTVSHLPAENYSESQKNMRCLDYMVQPLRRKRDMFQQRRHSGGNRSLGPAKHCLCHVTPGIISPQRLVYAATHFSRNTRVSATGVVSSHVFAHWTARACNGSRLSCLVLGRQNEEK